MVLALLSTFMPAASALTLGGYTFTTSVGDTWATLDLQLASMSNASRAQDWSATLAAYEDTATSPGVSLASLLPTVNSNGPSHPLASATAAYWSDALHGDALVRSAIGGTGEVANWDASSRRQILTKAAAYEVVRQHIMYRLRKGIDACNAGASGVADWEIGYALHAGSLEGTDGSGSGKSTYALGDKRCPQFDTCVAGTRIATNNQKALDAWQSGVTALAATNCFTALTASETILAQLTVPLVQGMVREAYEVDPNGGAATADGVVEVAEGWAFTTAILPQIAMCNASIAQLIRTNMALSLDGTNGAHVASGFRVVKSAIESQYPCLKITCADVGGMLASGAPIAGMEPCVDGAGSLPPAAPAPAAVPSPPIPECPSSSGIIIVLIVLLVLALVALVALALCMLCRKGGGESKEFSGITMNRT